jgi:hypothetical protein
LRWRRRSQRRGGRREVRRREERSVRRLRRSSRVEDFVKLSIKISEGVGIIHLNKAYCFLKGDIIYL